MTDSKHSKLPWQVESRHIFTSCKHMMTVAYTQTVYGAVMVGSLAESFSITDKEAVANAAFIVKACNSHAQIVAALEQAEGSFEMIREILVHHLAEPERQAFWKAVAARNQIRIELATLKESE